MRMFTQHPAAVGESYFEHLCVAAWFGVRLLTSGIACLLHALLPCCCQRFASRTVAALYAQMAERNPELQLRHPGRSENPGVAEASPNRA